MAKAARQSARNAQRAKTAQKPTTANGPGRGKSKTTRRINVSTGTVDEAMSLLPDFATYITSHGPALDRLPAPAAAGLTVTATRPMTMFADSHVEWTIAFIESSKIHAYLTTAINESKKKAGRPARVNVLALLVAMWLSAEDGKGLLIVNFRDVLFRRISPTMQRRLGILDTARPEDRDAAARWDAAAEISVRRTFHRVLARMDPSPYRKNRKRPWPEHHAMAKDVSDDAVRAAQGRLDGVCNQLLEAAIQTLPREIRRQYKGSACIDGTFMSSPSSPTSTKDGCDEASSDPDAGYYVRLGNHANPRLAEDGSPVRDDVFKRRTSTMKWGYDISLMVAVTDAPGERQNFPALPLAMTVEAPAVGPYDTARRLFASVRKRNYEPGYLAGDGLYTNSKPENFQIPAREYGYDLVLPFQRDHLGKQETHDSGMVLLEGEYACPAVPDRLAQATTDYRNKKIDLATYKEIIKERAQYRMRTKQRPKDGAGERLMCPAAGAAPTAKCPLKPTSMPERPTLQPDGKKYDARPIITPPPIMAGKERLDVCDKDSIAVTPTDGAKFRQSLPFGSTEHTATYNRLRQSQEGFHGFVKDNAHEDLGSAAKRRVKGKAAQTLFAAFLLSIASIRKIRRFLAEKQEDPKTGEIYVTRKVRTGKHATTDNPPGGYLSNNEAGAPAVVDDPPDIE